MKKRLLSLVFVVALLGSILLSACGEPAEENASEVAESSESQSSNEESAESSKSQSSDGDLVTLDTFDDFFGKMIELKYYEEKKISNDGATLSYSLKSDNRIYYDFSWEIEFEDGKNFTIPVSYNDISTKYGWEFDYKNDADRTLSTNRYVHVTIAKGHDKCKAEFVNMNSDDKKLSDLDVSGIKFEPLVDANNCPKFTILGGITNESTIQDVVNRLGNPETLEFNSASKEIKLNYYQKGNAYQYFYFTFNSTTGKIACVSIEND